MDTIVSVPDRPDRIFDACGRWKLLAIFRLGHCPPEAVGR